jgi:hypothetical protein
MYSGLRELLKWQSSESTGKIIFGDFAEKVALISLLFGIPQR